MAFDKTPFFVGGHYRDRKRGYIVLEMNERSIKVQYDDGSSETLDETSVGIKARIHQNIIAEFNRRHPVLSPSYFEMLGFLSRYGRFEAEVPNHSLSNFLTNYENLTGERLSKDDAGLFLLSEGDKWGPELRIYFPDTTHNFDFGSDIDVRAGWTQGTSRINNNKFWMRLISLGFRLGSNHDADKIRKTIPFEMRPNFDKGRTY